MASSRSRLNAYVVMAAAIAAVAGILFGFDTGVVSGAILFIQGQFHLSDTMKEIVISSVLVGAFVGSFVSGHFADRFGRRRLLIVTSLIFIIGTLDSALARSVTELIISRFVVGFAIGIASFTAPLYISEVSPPQYRGALVSLNQLAVTVGILVAYLIDIAFVHNHDNWRWMFGCGVIPAVVLFIGMLVLPYSPRWLILNNRILEATETLKKIRGFFYDQHEIEDIQAAVKEKGDWHMLFKKWLLPAVIIGIMLGLLQQFTGINTIIYYAPTIFKMTGVQSNAGAILATVGIGVVNVLFTIVALPLIDRWGRRPLLLTGMSAMFVSLCMMALSFHYAAEADYLKWFAMGSMLLFIAGFAISLGPIMWLIIAEIFPLEIRGFATSTMVSLSWLFNFIVAQTFLTLIQALGQSGTFIIYATICLCGLVFVLFKVPETKGTTLEQIENNLRAGVPSRHLGK